MMAQAFEPITWRANKRRGVILTLAGAPHQLLTEIYTLILNDDDREYLLFKVIDWFSTNTVEEMDVGRITSLVMEYIFKECVNIIGHSAFSSWYKRQGQLLRTRLILFTIHLKDRLLQYHLYDGPSPEHSKLHYAYLSTRGSDALLLAYVEPS